MHGWPANAIFALGLALGVGGGFLAGRKYERAAHAWNVAIPRVRHARLLTKQAVGTVLVAAGIVALVVVMFSKPR